MKKLYSLKTDLQTDIKHRYERNNSQILSINEKYQFNPNNIRYKLYKSHVNRWKIDAICHVHFCIEQTSRLFSKLSIKNFKLSLIFYHFNRSFYTKSIKTRYTIEFTLWKPEVRAHRQNNERKPSFHIQTTPPHEIYALPFNENFCVQFIHIMKHFVLYLWFLGLCFDCLGRCHVALGGGNDMAIDDDPLGRDLCVFASYLMGFCETFARTAEKLFFSLPVLRRQTIIQPSISTIKWFRFNYPTIFHSCLERFDLLNFDFCARNLCRDQ